MSCTRISKHQSEDQMWIRIYLQGRGRRVACTYTHTTRLLACAAAELIANASDNQRSVEQGGAALPAGAVAAVASVNKNVVVGGPAGRALCGGTIQRRWPVASDDARPP